MGKGKPRHNEKIIFEYDVNGYHVIVHGIYIDGKEIEFTPCSLEFAVTEEEIRGGMGTTYKPKIKHMENADKYGLSKVKAEKDESI